MNQRQLDVVVDCDFGNQTQRGVEQFQRDASLPVSGIVTSQTWAALTIPAAWGRDINLDRVIAPTEVTLVCNPGGHVDVPTPATALAAPVSTVAAPIGAAPQMLVTCPPFASGPWTRYRATFGYTSWGQGIVEWGMDYGDGHSYTAHNEVDAQSDVYWHTYHQPGAYIARAWVIDSSGRRAESSCQVSWAASTQRQQVVTANDDNYDRSYDDGSYDDGGDLDCVDIGEEVYIDGDDPNNLDADGDGIGCEGW